MEITTMQKCIALIALLFGLFNTIQVITQINQGLTNVARSPKRKSGDKFDDRTSGLSWFVQVSDLHISIFTDHQRSEDFIQLCHFLKASVKPQAVVLTGDLTDAKAKDKLGSRQFEAEWKMYHDTMETCGAFDTQSDITWLDVRGNHDTFNTETPNDDFYSRFAIRSKEPRSYFKVLKSQNTSIGFVSMDATLTPGPKRPFNFFGSLSPQELEEFTTTLRKAQDLSDYQIVFGHYPTSCVLSPNPGLKSVIGSNANTLAYLCGHLHTLNGLAPHMYSSQPQGFLELELGDWKDNRIFRIMAIDQGQLAFHDMPFDANTTALAVPLNPIDMTFVQPLDASMILQSSHLRMLIFSKQIVSKVQVKIDDTETYDLKATPVKSLYVAPWKPSKFADGKIHKLVVILNGDQILSQSQFVLGSSDFSLGTTGWLAKIVLYFNWSLVTQAVFGFCASSIVLPLCYMRMRPQWRHFSGLYRLSKTDKLFYPLVFAALYISIGPWALGYFLDDQLGLLFPWGLFIDGHVLPADVTHLYGIIFMFPYLYLLTFGLAFKINRPKRSGDSICLYWFKTNFIFATVMLMQLLHCVEFYLCYGVLATLLGTCGLGRVLFVYYLWATSNQL